MAQKNIVALDMGYSNLKGAFGLHGTKVPSTFVKPAGAAPITSMAQSVGRTRQDDSIQIEIEGETWVAGVDPSRLDRYERDLHEDYPSTNTYKALFSAGLIEAGMPEVDRLVTGLPVSQSKDKALCNALKQRLTGTFQITPKQSVTVKRVDVIAQPVGAYMDFLFSKGDVDALEDASVLVVDPGFFSVDWVVIDSGDMIASAAGTSTEAMSYVLQEADTLIRADYGKAVGLPFIEAAVRKGRGQIAHVGGSQIDLSSYLDKASAKVAKTAMTKMRQSLRSLPRQPQIILMAGGGAANYQAVAQEVFPDAKVEMPEDPVTANVRGFWHFANGKA